MQLVKSLPHLELELELPWKYGMMKTNAVITNTILETVIEFQHPCIWVEYGKFLTVWSFGCDMDDCLIVEFEISTYWGRTLEDKRVKTSMRISSFYLMQHAKLTLRYLGKAFTFM